MMKALGYIGQIFSGENCASFARWATAATISIGCWAMIHLVRLNHKLPDAMEIGALAAWMTAPYSINKVAAAFQPAGDHPR
jgi:hypothetical protein